MVQAARSGVLAGLIGLATPVLASPLTTLQQTARSCFESPSAARCDAVWDLSASLRQQADQRHQLSCYTSLLALEAMVAKAKLGAGDPPRQARALQDTAVDCGP